MKWFVYNYMKITYYFNMCNSSCNIYIILTTSVSGVGKILYFCTTVISAIFTSNIPNLCPMQFLGPWPKGKNEQGLRLAFSSGVNLRN